MSRKNRLAIDEVSTKDFSTITGTYSQMDTNPITTHAAALILLQNGTDIPIMVSDDGTTDKFPMLSNSYILLDLDKYVSEPQISLPAGVIFSIKQIGATAATSGKVYITVFYPAG